MGDINRTLAANAGDDIAKQGSFVFVKSATADVTIQIEGNSITMGQGDRWDYPRTFDGLRVVNTAGVPNAVVLVIGAGQYNRSEVSGSVAVDKGATTSMGNHTPGLAAAQLLPLDATRRSILIFNNSTTDTIYLGHDNTVTAGNGYPLPPKGQVGWNDAPQAAVWAITGAGPVDCRTLEEFD